MNLSLCHQCCKTRVFPAVVSISSIKKNRKAPGQESREAFEEQLSDVLAQNWGIDKVK